jgi:hypothetical protein
MMGRFIVGVVLIGWWKMKTKLEEIKKLHEEAVKSSQIAFDTGSCAEEDNVKDILSDLFQKQHTDWLIEQAELVEKLKEALEEIVATCLYGQTDSLGEGMVEVEETCDSVYQIAEKAVKSFTNSK